MFYVIFNDIIPWYISNWFLYFAYFKSIFKNLSLCFRRKMFHWWFFFYINSIVFLTYKEISVRCIHSLQYKMHIYGCFIQSKKCVVAGTFWSTIFFSYIPAAAPFKIGKVYVWVTNGMKIEKCFFDKTVFSRVKLMRNTQLNFLIRT